MDVLYRDDSLLVVDKPAGVPVLPDGWEPESPYLVQTLEAEFGRVWVVHRLDKITSGVMVFARTAGAHRSLNIAFQKHEAHKLYHAIAIGVPAWNEHIARHRLLTNVGHHHRTVVNHSKGRPAETSFRVLARSPGYALLEAAPLTGRTHQVRVHATALGLTLLGDSLYGAPPTDLIARPALHARSLSFVHPDTGERLQFSTAYPPDFAAALKQIGF